MAEKTNHKNYKTKNPAGKFFVNRFLKTVISTIRPLQIDKILDAGCGEGYALNRLHNEKIGKVYEGIDRNEEAITLGHELYPELKLKVGDIYNLPYAENEFDLVICTEVLERLENPRKALKELIRVSNKYVLLSVPNEPFFTIQRIGRLKNVVRLGTHPGHMHHWTIPGFLKFVKIRGVKIIARKFPTPWTMVLLKKV